ncbi:helix-turn-helix domain-containing protein [Streptomyces sp. NBC_01017]|uniref:helix-turn-helix domain-containing protein n=1 Tax=Streptomyces sp. NBC_01017 TaxID=2903721 RepID=UPI0038672D95|nr:helix-turn-helix domain-containing protein [Streptomyces sp. NBC_01017]WSV35252.1 helix-turn-helix domain-containing protein [Streptomyces sp. NBC_01017]
METWFNEDADALDSLISNCGTGLVQATVKDVAGFYGMTEDAVRQWLESIFRNSTHDAVEQASADVIRTEVNGWDNAAWSRWLREVCIQAGYPMTANPPSGQGAFPGPVSAPQPQQQIQGAGYVWTPDPPPQPAPPPVHPHPATHAWSQMDENVLIHWLDWLAQMDQQPTWDTIADGLAAFLASEDIHDDPTAWWTTAWQSPDGRIAYLRQYQSRKADLSALDAQIAYAWQSTQWALANQQQTQNQPQAQPPAYTWTPDQQTQHYPQTTPQTHPPAQHPQTHPRNQPTPHPAPPPSSGQPKPLKRKQPPPDPNLTEHKSNQGKRQRPAVGENDFSRRIWKVREEAGLTQKELAKKASLGIHFIAKGESGIYIDPGTARRWIQAVTDNTKIQEKLQTLYNAIYQDGRDPAKLAFWELMLRLRENRGFSRVEVAVAVGVGNATISKWESGAVMTPGIKGQNKVNMWINFLTAGLKDRESVRRELRQLYEREVATPGRMFFWTD